MMENRICFYIFFLFCGAFLVGFVLQNPALFLSDEFVNFPDEKFNFVRPISSWLNYSYFSEGFGRRLVFGTLLYVFSPEHRIIVYSVISLLIVLGVLWLTLLLISKLSETTFLVLLLAAYCISPAGIQNWGWLFGYFEFFNHALLIGALLLVFKKKYHLHLFFTIIFGLLIHLSFLFYAVPLVISTLVYIHPPEKLINSKTVAVGAISVTVAFLLVKFGNSDIPAMGANRSVFQTMDFDWVNYSVVLLYTSLIAILHIRYFGDRLIRYKYVFIAPYFSFLLFLTGVDYMRWISIFFFAMVSSVFVVEFLSRGVNERAKEPVIFDKLLLVALAFPFLGPLGNTNSFGALRQLLSLVT